MLNSLFANKVGLRLPLPAPQDGIFLQLRYGVVHISVSANERIYHIALAAPHLPRHIG